MTHDISACNRRSVLQTGGVLLGLGAMGLPVATGSAAADSVPSIEVDVPPRIPEHPRGQVVTATYPGGEIGPSAVVDSVEQAGGGFRLGPLADPDDPDPADVVNHAEAIDRRLVNNGFHGEVLGVFFDPETAAEWFIPGETFAKVSAVGGTDILAWGWQSVTIPGTS